MSGWRIGISLEQVEKEAILHALEYYDGNKALTARKLDISIRALYNKLKKYEEEYGAAYGGAAGIGSPDASGNDPGTATEGSVLPTV